MLNTLLWPMIRLSSQIYRNLHSQCIWETLPRTDTTKTLTSPQFGQHLPSILLLITTLRSEFLKSILPHPIADLNLDLYTDEEKRSASRLCLIWDGVPGVV